MPAGFFAARSLEDAAARLTRGTLRDLLLAAAGSPPEPGLPSDLTAELRHYQHDGVAWLVLLRDAGLGRNNFV